MDRLAFLSQSGPDAVEQLCRELDQRGLGVEDLLRLRLFACEREALEAIVGELERLLPRLQWPALSAVELAADPALPPALDAIAAPRAHRTRVAVRVPGVPQAMRFGQWLFVGALSARCPDGLSLHEQIQVQSRELFARMEQLLRAGAAEPRHVVKVGGWLSFSMGDYEPLANVRSDLLERFGLLPASAAVQSGPIFDLAAEADRFDAAGDAPLLSFEAIAFVPARLPLEPSRPEPPPAISSPLAPYYANARRAGEHVFTCGEIPREAGPIEQEVRDVCEQLHVHLAQHGALSHDVLQQTVFLRHSEDAPVVQRELAAWLGRDDVATTVLPALDMGFRPAVNVEVEVVAAIPPPSGST